MSDHLEQHDDDSDSMRSILFERADANKVPLRTILATVGVVVAVFIAGKLLYRLRDILLLMLVGAFIALLLNPLVVILQFWKLPRRGAAVFVVTMVGLAIFLALAFVFGYPLVNAITHLVNALPRYISKAEHGQGWIGHALRRYHVKSWIDKNSSKILSYAKGFSKPALALGKGAATLLIELITVFAFVVLLLLEGPKIRKALLAVTSPRTSTWITRVSNEVGKSALGYMLGNLVTSVIAGLVVFSTLTLLSVPFAFLWALWVALVDFLPQIGGALAGIPTVLFALVHSVSAGIVTALVFLAYTQLENHALNPVIMSRTVKINPLTVFVSVIVAAVLGSWVDGIFGGFVAVLLAIPAAATMHVVFREVWSATHTTPLQSTEVPRSSFDAPAAE